MDLKVDWVRVMITWSCTTCS